MRFSVFQVSRKGGRKNNEDRMGYCYTSESAVLVMADGMGGHPEGEVASQLALQAVAALFHKMALPNLADVSGFLADAVMAAHRQILHYATGKAMFDTPRTTIVVAVIQSGGVTWTHCGDSRLYLVRQNELLVRTRDHSFLEQGQGCVAGMQGPVRLNRNVLFTCLGSPTKPIFNVTGPLALLQGDKIMMCSDGLWSSLTEDEIVFELSQKSVEVAVPDLVEKALRKAGEGSDNVTCLALAWETPDAFESTRGGLSVDTVKPSIFESTKHSGWQDLSLDDLDDADIERSIAEINEAIRRSAERNR
jgi:serine/threonine protein phosphatase PrpC